MHLACSCATLNRSRPAPPAPPAPPQDGNSYTSARLNTKPTASFYPGMRLSDGTGFASIHVEARLQLPAPGQGLWPAFWMFPTGGCDG